MRPDFLILGATGMQGKIVTRDLTEHNYRIFISCHKEKEIEKLKQLYPMVSGRILDLRDHAAAVKLIAEVQPRVIINCAEGDWNLNVYQAALEAGCHVIDLGSDIPTTEKQIAMNTDFEKRNLTAITGCGSTPGINNVTLNYAIQNFDSVETIEAGFAWSSDPKKFVVPFSMQSIIEEFTDPAPVIEKGVWINKAPLETVVERQFREIGEQKCFLVKHPETFTFFFYQKNKGVKNVRFYAGFPPHSFHAIRSYINDDTAEERVVYVSGKGQVELSSLTRVLQEMSPPPPGYTEKENLWVVIEGEKDAKPKRVLIECIVPTLPGWEDAGCNIDTGFPASIIGQMILSGVITKRGSFAPEPVVPPGPFFDKLAKRQMKIYINAEAVN